MRLRFAPIVVALAAAVVLAPLGSHIMEIRIILDDRIVNGAKRIFSRSGLAALTALTLLAGGAALVAQEASDELCLRSHR